MKTIIIIGGGFSGTALCYHLHEYFKQPLKILLIERTKNLGKGLAYASSYMSHLLNVKAENMSLMEDNPDDFVYWLDNNKRQLRGISRSAPLKSQYIPRKYYGDYLESIMQRLITTPNAGFSIEVIADEVIDIIYGQPCTCLLDSGNKLTADHIVLAIGNPLPLPLKVYDLPKACPEYIPNPWDTKAISVVHKNAHVVIIGSGLTMVDVAMSLTANGHEGQIDVLSRHGLLPRAHTRLMGNSPPLNLEDNSLLGLFRALRKLSKENKDWTALMDAFEPNVQAFWQDLSLRERTRFMKYLQTYWNVHRHRISPHIAGILRMLISRKQLNIVAGKVMRIDYIHEGFSVKYMQRDKKHEVQELYGEYLINCTGPATDYEKVKDKLIQKLMSSGVIVADRMGLKSNQHCNIINKRGEVLHQLWTLGQTTQGRLFDIITVPYIRKQCKELAQHILSILESS